MILPALLPIYHKWNMTSTFENIVKFLSYAILEHSPENYICIIKPNIISNSDGSVTFSFLTDLNNTDMRIYLNTQQNGKLQVLLNNLVYMGTSCF